MSSLQTTNITANQDNYSNSIVNPLMPTVAIWVHMAHPVPDRNKPSFVIFDNWALWHSALTDTRP